MPQGVVCRGCGNPTVSANLQEGEIVLDLGSGAGLDAFLAARKVGPTGRVIGVDASAEIVATASQHAATGDFHNVEFRVGVMTALPSEEHSVDIVISNCVVNYAADISIDPGYQLDEILAGQRHVVVPFTEHCDQLGAVRTVGIRRHGRGVTHGVGPIGLGTDKFLDAGDLLLADQGGSARSSG